MREILLTAFAAAMVLAAGAAGSEAITFTARSALGATAVQAPLVQQVVNVCGSNGCAPVQTKRVQHQKPGSVAAKHI
jgi:hypothetical protein